MSNTFGFSDFTLVRTTSGEGDFHFGDLLDNLKLYLTDTQL